MLLTLLFVQLPKLVEPDAFGFPHIGVGNLAPPFLLQTFPHPHLKLGAGVNVRSGSQSRSVLQVVPELLPCPRSVWQPEYQHQFKHSGPQTAVLQSNQSLVHTLVNNIPKDHKRQPQFVRGEENCTHVVCALQDLLGRKLSFALLGLMFV